MEKAICHIVKFLKLPLIGVMLSSIGFGADLLEYADLYYELHSHWQELGECLDLIDQLAELIRGFKFLIRQEQSDEMGIFSSNKEQSPLFRI